MAALQIRCIAHCFRKSVMRNGPCIINNAHSINLIPCAANASSARRGFHATSPNADVFNVQDEEDFDKKVLKSSLPVIVDFHAVWCGPCKLLAPRLESLMNAYHGKMHLAKVDIDELSELALEYDVTAVPAVLGFKGGEVIDQFIGLLDEDQIKTFLETVSGPKA